jgi:hypothetical protein
LPHNKNNGFISRKAKTIIYKEVKQMPDYTSRKRLKEKVLNRWENEGGRLSADQTNMTTESSPPEISETEKVQRQVLDKNTSSGKTPVARTRRAKRQ